MSLALLALPLGCAFSTGPVTGTFGDALVCRNCTVTFGEKITTVDVREGGELVWTGTISEMGSATTIAGLGLLGLAIGGPPGAGVGAGLGVADKALPSLIGPSGHVGAPDG